MDMLASNEMSWHATTGKNIPDGLKDNITIWVLSTRMHPSRRRLRAKEELTKRGFLTIVHFLV